MSSVSSALLGAAAGGLSALAVAPYLARISLSAADRSDRRWWRGAWHARTTRRRLAVVASVAGVLGALAGCAAGWSVALPAFVAFAMFATPLAVIDAQHHRLPDRLVVPGAVAALVLLAGAAAVRRDWDALARAGEAAGVIFVAFFLVASISPRSMGFGDVKLAAVIGGYLGWVGWSAVFYGLFAGFLLGAAMSVPLLATRRASLNSSIPLGPALIAGALLVASAHAAF